MFNVFCPIADRKKKTQARGFWRDNGKVYYDYLEFKTAQDVSYIEFLRQDLKQIAIFYEDLNNFLGIISDGANKTILKHKRIIRIPKEFNGLKWRIKNYLEVYGGLTIFKRVDCYIIEAWSA